MVQAPQKKPAPPNIDFGMEDDEDDLYQVFATEKIAPPPVKQYGRKAGSGLKLPFDKLVVVGQWFLLPPMPVDKEAKKKEKARYSSYVYKTHKEGPLAGRKFKLIEVDARFATDIKKPELAGRYGVWRTE